MNAPKSRPAVPPSTMSSRTAGTVPYSSYCHECATDYKKRCTLLRHLRDVHQKNIPRQKSGPRRRYPQNNEMNKTSGSEDEQRPHEANEANIESSYIDELQRSCNPWGTETWYTDSGWQKDHFWECNRLLPEILKLPRLESMSEDSKCGEFAFPKIVRSMDVVGEYSMTDVCDFVTKRKVPSASAWSILMDIQVQKTCDTIGEGRKCPFLARKSEGLRFHVCS